MATPTRLLLAVLVSLFLPFTRADGRGLIGYGITMYNPPCAAACRAVIEGATLLCTPHDHADHGGHGHGATPPECYATDRAFMQTLALCISEQCSDKYTADVYERYWRRNEVGGGRVVLEPKPSMSYAEALASIEEDPIEVYVSGDPLNKTSSVSDEDWQGYLNALVLFEHIETGHQKYRYAKRQVCRGTISNVTVVLSSCSRAF
jgi:hypothetical protein